MTVTALAETDTLEMYRGDATAWNFTLTDDSVAVNISGATIRFTVRTDFPSGSVASDADAVFTVTTADNIVITDAAAGKFTVTVIKAKTSALNIFGKTEYKYGLEIILTGETEPTTIGFGKFIIYPDVVRA